MTRSNLILMLDRNARNLELLGNFLLKQGYDIVSTTELDAFAEAVDAQEIGLALVDISGFDRGIWDYCQMLSERDIPFIVISPRQVAEIRDESRQHGASDVMSKPLAAKELTSVIRSLIDQG